MNYLKGLSIEHYKGFFEEQHITFGIPDGINKGSGLTVIVGPNNTGKTSIMEALLIHTSDENYGGFGKDSKFLPSERHTNFNPKITIRYSNEGIDDSVTYTNIANGSQIKKENNEKNHGLRFSVIQSRRYRVHKTGNRIYNKDIFESNTRFMEMRNPTNIDTAAILTQINKDQKLKNVFNDLLKRIVPNLTERTIDTDDDNNDYIKYFTGLGASHNSGQLGDGIISIFRICAQLTVLDNMILIIDEPELSLHPQAQKKLSVLLSEEAKNRQIIVCTHSSYFARREDFINGAKFVRLNKYGDLKCTISCLDNNKNYSSFISSNILSYQKPQLLDISSKEIMFSEKILFVEGIEDVGLIKKFANENNINLMFDIFGYGVGGYSNMKFFLELAHDLGLQKVGVLYDNGPDTMNDYENFSGVYMDYKFQKLETDDIRDKPIKYGEKGIEKEAKIGIFNEHGTIKPEYIDYFKTIIEIFNSYFCDGYVKK